MRKFPSVFVFPFLSTLMSCLLDRFSDIISLFRKVMSFLADCSGRIVCLLPHTIGNVLYLLLYLCNFLFSRINKRRNPSLKVPHSFLDLALDLVLLSLSFQCSIP